jgi:mitochondrial transcription factor 1
MSRKLHDYLKPKRHLLMEPDPRYQEPFIKPLLEKPGSTYRHTTLTGAHPVSYWSNYRTAMLDPELLDLPLFSEGDSRLRQLNKNVLLLGNLGRTYTYQRRSGAFTYDQVPTKLLIQMIIAAIDNTLFHQTGLVRMLWWLPEDKKSLVLPISEREFQKNNAMCNVAASINEVAGSVSFDGDKPPGMNVSRQAHQRIPDMRIVTRAKIKDSMKELGMRKVRGRDFLLGEIKGKLDPKDLVSPLREYSTLTEFRQDIQEVTARYKLFCVIEQTGGKNRQAAPSSLLDTIEYPTAAPVIKAQVDPSLYGPTKRDDYSDYAILATDMILRIIRLEAGLRFFQDQPKSAPTRKAQLENAEKQIRALDTDFTEWMHTAMASHWVLEKIPRAIDTHVAYFQQPPLLAHEARTYPPLKVEPHEFWPPKPLMLLDVTPKSNYDLAVPDLASADEVLTILRALTKALYSHRSAPLPTQLDRVAPNAAQDLIPMVPAITDPRKGGRLDPMKVRVKMMSPEMLVGLAKAWVEWPFRPSSVEMELMAADVRVPDGESTGGGEVPGVAGGGGEDGEGGAE